MAETRFESDSLGQRELPADAFYGIHAARAEANFPLSGRPVHPELLRAFGAVKLACARTNHELGRWDEPAAGAIFRACEELMEGTLLEAIRVDALQGGAGTSTNMAVNEVLTNRALVLLGQRPGSYGTLDPLEDLNRHQSTNDTFPTALRIAGIRGLRALEPALVRLIEAFQKQERAFSGIVKVGRTEYQDAVLITLGREMGAYAEALSRDRWRLHQCEERLRVVNLGGTAVGTGVGAPRAYIFRVVEILRDVTHLGLAAAENRIDATQNADPLAEVSGILRTCAISLIKISGDLRLLSSGPVAGLGEIRLPPMQAGSSLMPGKVNPVIPEAVTQAAMRVLAHDQEVVQACAAGSLELNPFLPLIADALLDSLDLLRRSCEILAGRCVDGLTADEDRCRRLSEGTTAAATALVAPLGYARAQQAATAAREEGKGIRAVVVDRGWLTAEEYDRWTSAEAVTRLGSPETP